MLHPQRQLTDIIRRAAVSGVLGAFSKPKINAISWSSPLSFKQASCPQFQNQKLDKISSFQRFKEQKANKKPHLFSKTHDMGTEESLIHDLFFPWAAFCQSCFTSCAVSSTDLRNKHLHPFPKVIFMFLPPVCSHSDESGWKDHVSGAVILHSFVKLRITSPPSLGTKITQQFWSLSNKKLLKWRSFFFDLLSFLPYSYKGSKTATGTHDVSFVRRYQSELVGLYSSRTTFVLCIPIHFSITVLCVFVLLI